MSIDKINFKEAEYFYKSPHALADYSQMQSFSIIKSAIELFSYYGITDFSCRDVKAFFERLGLVQKKNGKVLIPSEKKISGVLECCLTGHGNRLSFQDGIYHIVAWDHRGYACEIRAAADKHLI